jgi:multidrug efflux pump subunit AcrA (membrane-fusion protein)
MSDGLEVVERTHSGLFVGLVGFAFFASLAALIWNVTLERRLEKSQTLLTVAMQRNDKLAAELDKTNDRLRVETETLGHSLGLTQQEMQSRADELSQKQQADSARIEHEQARSKQQLGAVSGEVSNVKTDIGGVKTDVAQTKSELQSTETRLQSALGDLGLQSGLIATNSKELEILKHKGDRNYYEFTLRKGGRPTPLSGVSLVLKKADPKHSRYTLVVNADDRKIEKKDKGLNEPVQFYTGKQHLLYEIVVNSIDKNQVQGYLATPKGAPEPLNP